MGSDGGVQRVWGSRTPYDLFVEMAKLMESGYTARILVCVCVDVDPLRVFVNETENDGDRIRVSVDLTDPFRPRRGSTTSFHDDAQTLSCVMTDDGVSMVTLSDHRSPSMVTSSGFCHAGDHWNDQGVEYGC